MIPIYIYYCNKEHVKSDVMATECLKHYCRIKDVENKIYIFRDSYGKPYSNIRGVHLSISHTEGIWVCAVCGLPIGVDIERNDTEINASLMEKIYPVLSGNLLRKGWTKIESCSKLIGKGLSTDLNDLVDCINSNYFSFLDIALQEEYCCTVCLRQDNNEIEIRYIQMNGEE